MSDEVKKLTLQVEALRDKVDALLSKINTEPQRQVIVLDEKEYVVDEMSDESKETLEKLSLTNEDIFALEKTIRKATFQLGKEKEWAKQFSNELHKSVEPVVETVTKEVK